MSKKIALIAIAVIVAFTVISSTYMMIQSNASKDAAVLQVEVDSLQDDLKDLENDLEDITKENIELVSRKNEASQDNIALEEEIEEINVQMNKLNKEIPKEDTGISAEYYLGQIGIILKENDDLEGYNAISALPIKREADNGNLLATIFISGDEDSEKFLKIVIEIDRYNNFMSKVSLSHVGMTDLYSEYKTLLVKGLIMVIESAYYFDEEIIDSADTIITDGKYENANVVLSEEVKEDGTIFTIAPEE